MIRIRTVWVWPVFAITLAACAIVLLAIPIDQELGRDRPVAPPRPPVVAAAPRQAALLATAPRPVAPSIADAPRPEQLVARVETAKGFSERVAVVQAFAAATPDDAGSRALERLLDRPMPGTADEVKRTRIAIILQLGRYRGPSSEGCLLALAATVESSKQERLAALEGLRRRGTLGETAPPLLRALAEQDAEPEIRFAANRLLAAAPRS